MKVGRLTLSDRASSGVYEDASGPEIERVIQQLFAEPLEFVRVLRPDDRAQIEAELIRLADDEGCPLIVTTGGTGPSARDVTPEATRAVIEKELPGFGEVIRLHSYVKVRTAILSRALAGVRGRSLIINLPGKPTAIAECLPLVAPAIAECLDHIAGFRPRLANS
ncbi:MAG: molybdopterin adenylyltransferase [Verrucomicrobia bacterium Tous-C9LFEB]|nr:MAG: molybdopterin adenylyltransferase [Verrucomicrobia bacterium Tous-C9LFEB]